MWGNKKFGVRRYKNKTVREKKSTLSPDDPWNLPNTMKELERRDSLLNDMDKMIGTLEYIPGNKPEMVNGPAHYKSNKFEVIEIIEEFKLGFNLGNLVKYVLRAGKKDPSKHLEDLEKAQYYLKREIDNLKNNK